MLYRKIFLVLFFLTIPVSALTFGVNADTLVQRDTTVVKDTSDSSNSDRETIAVDFANRLKSQLNLTEDQTEKVRASISSFIDSYSEENSAFSALDENITLILDDTQRSSWQSVKEGFRSDIERRLSEEAPPQNKNKEDDE